MLINLLMKKLYLRISLLTILCILVGTISSINAQVGINTTSPSDGAMLDIDSDDKGLLVPRVNIADLSTIDPITGGSTESLLVYNTNNGTGTGFHYWNGSIWVALGGDFWKMEGNDSTDPGVTTGKDFVGTTDSEILILGTNRTAALTVTTNQRLQAGENGSRSQPTYTFEDDPNTGIWRSTGDRLNLGAGNLEFIELQESGNDALLINDRQADINTNIASENQANMLFVDGGNDRLGIFNGSPDTDVHIGGTATEVRLDAFSGSNNSNNNGVDAAAVYVDSNGNLTLEGPLTLNNMPEDNLTTFVPVTAVIEAPGGSSITAGTLYTTSITLTQDALIEVVYQLGVNVSDIGGAPITDGAPRQYGTALFIDGNLVGYTSEAYTSSFTGSGTFCNGTFFLNGNGYAQLTGAAAGTTYTVSVVGFVWGADFGVRGEFGGSTGADRFQLILHH